MFRSADVLAALASDVTAGILPQVSIVISRQNVSEHAPFSPTLGERYMHDLLQIFKASPAVYAKTAVLLMYDEGASYAHAAICVRFRQLLLLPLSPFHSAGGQFFDHAHTPLPPLETPRDGASTLAAGSNVLEGTMTPAGGLLPVGMGFRVPLLIISPWTRGGHVFSGVLDHVSPLLLIEKRFNVRCPNISPWRRAVTGDMLAAFDFASPDFSWPVLPALPSAAEVDAAFKDQCAKNPAPAPPPALAQVFPAQEPGTRPSRALPYTFLVTDALVAAAAMQGGFSITLSIRNGGAAGAAFLLLDALNLVAQPARNFLVEAGKSLVDSPQLLRGPGTRYAFSLHGPNGFVRQFAGDAAQASAAGLAAALTYDEAAGNVVLQLSAGAGAAATSFTVSDNAFGLAGSPWTVPVPAGGQVAFPVAVCAAAVGCWYDLSISEAPTMSASGFQRRFMGRMEVGRDTISDPAMAAGVSPNAGRPLSGIAPLVPASGPLFAPALIASANAASAAAAAVAAAAVATASASPGISGSRSGGGSGAAATTLSSGAIVGATIAAGAVALGAAWLVLEQRRRSSGLRGASRGGKRSVFRPARGDGVGELV